MSSMRSSPKDAFIWCICGIWKFRVELDITLFSHVGRFHDLGICQLYYVGPLNKTRVFLYYSCIQVQLGNLGGVMLLALCIGIIIHPNIIP